RPPQPPRSDSPPPPQPPPPGQVASSPAPTTPMPPPAPAVPEPPAETPAEFKSIARRSYKKLNTDPPSPARDRLLQAYTAFVHAVQAQSPEVEGLGDTLDDVYKETMS